MTCMICGERVVLVPSAKERARKFGGKPSDYTQLFQNHTDCTLRKRADAVTALLNRKDRKAQA